MLAEGIHWDLELGEFSRRRIPCSCTGHREQSISRGVVTPARTKTLRLATAKVGRCCVVNM